LTISATNKAALESAHSGRIYFLFLDLVGDPLHACTGTKTYSFDGEDWLGIGEIAGFSDFASAADLAARPITITLSGVDAWVVEPILSRTNYKGRDVKIYRGLIDSDEDIIDDPYLIWEGRMDVGSMLYADTYAAQISCEPKTAQLLRPNISRYSDEDHQQRHDGDKFYEFLSQMEAKDVMWGGQRVSMTRWGGGGLGGGGGGFDDDGVKTAKH